MKFKATKTVYITVNFNKADGLDYSGYITLLNSKKKAISDKTWVYADSSTSYKAVFGVKKGQTYYLRVSDIYDKANIKYTETAVSEKSGSTIKKAVTLAKNKTKKGVIVAGDKTADFYKVVLKKAGSFKIQVKGDSTGYIYVQPYNSKGKKIGSAYYVVYGNNSNRTVYTLNTFSKGTYYIKVYGKNAKASGHYSLKLK